MERESTLSLDGTSKFIYDKTKKDKGALSVKRVKQILAIICIVLLVGLYLSTLILAITDHTGTMEMFFASVLATVIIPILIWVYAFIYRLVKKNKDEPEESKKE